MHLPSRSELRSWEGADIDSLTGGSVNDTLDVGADTDRGIGILLETTDSYTRTPRNLVRIVSDTESLTSIKQAHLTGNSGAHSFIITTFTGAPRSWVWVATTR